MKRHVSPGRHKKAWVWVVVMVQSGIPATVCAFRQEDAARKRLSWLSRRIRPDYDAVGIFRVQVPE